ncbi:MAG: stage V sporulation protein AB [Clostridium sp.]|nr:stage V sporulation protein AB [Clostridium sp.]
MEQLLLAILGLGFGVFTAGGVFTTVIVVALIPRFAARFHTAYKIELYEEWIVAGAVAGGIFGVYSHLWETPSWEERGMLLKCAGIALVILWAFFTGMFVGCLALAIEEMLGGLPVFARRVHLRKGLGIIILSIAAAKLAGSLCYFYFGLF